LAELFGGNFSWRPAPALYSEFARNFSDLLPGKEWDFRMDQVHDFVDADGRVPLFAQDEFCHIGSSGFQAGYNYQIGSFVPGLETDFDYLGNCRGGTFAAPPAYAPFGIGSYSLSGGCSYYFGTLRARLGYAFDRVLGVYRAEQ
jgi:outer membrane immunogenic protein